MGCGGGSVAGQLTRGAATPTSPMIMQEAPDPPGHGGHSSCVWRLVIGPEATHWSRQLVHEHLGRRARLAVFSTCRDGRDFILDTAEQAEVHLHIEEDSDLDQDPEDVQHPPSLISPTHLQLISSTPRPTHPPHQPNLLSPTRLNLISSALRLRGTLSSKLDLTASSLAPLARALTVLAAAGPLQLQELRLHLHHHQETLPTSLLATIAAWCPSLKVLFIIPPSALPDPTLFPNLEELNMRCHHADPAQLEHIFRTAGAYVPQLTRLSLCSTTAPAALPAVLPLLLNPDHAGARLRDLTIDAVLCDTLLGLLLGCAPALQRLSVRDLQLKHDAHDQYDNDSSGDNSSSSNVGSSSGRSCSSSGSGSNGGSSGSRWQWLQIAEKLHLSSLARLPVPPGLELIAGDGDLVCDVATTEAVKAVMQRAARLKDLRVNSINGCHVIGMEPGHMVHVDDESMALRAGLCLLRASRTLCVRPAAITLWKWTLSPALLSELPGLPPWRALSLGHVQWWSEAHLYATLLRQLPGSFCQVTLSPGDSPFNRLTPAHFESICLGAPVSRTAEAPLHIKLRYTHDLAEAIQHRMQLGGFPNVVVSGT